MTRGLAAIAKTLGFAAICTTSTLPAFPALADTHSDATFSVHVGLSPIIPLGTMLGMSAAAGLLALILQRRSPRH